MNAAANMQKQPPIGAPRRIFVGRCGASARVAAGVLGLVSLIAGGCATTEVRTVADPVEIPAAFSVSGETPLPAQWWEAFDDPTLNELIERALSDNLDLGTAWDRLAQVEATARTARAELSPALELDAAGSHSYTQSRISLPTGRTKQTSESESFSLGLAASYELDLWGRVRATSDAAALDVQATAEDLRTAAITLSAEVATTWYQLVEQRGQQAILADQLQTNEQVLELTELRFRRGQVGAVDVLQQRQLVESTRGEMQQVQSSRAVLEHRLMILLGRPPTDGAPEGNGELIDLPPLPETGVPAEVLQRRPDLRSAYFDLLAADRRVAAAVADRFPRVSLSTGLSTSAKNLRDLFDNWVANLAANLAAPILDGGRRRAEVDRTRAVVSERLHAWGQSLLDGLGEVEDALVQEARQRRYIDSLEKQLTLSEEVVDRTRDSYTNGAVDYLRVLDALSSNQSLQRNVLQARRRLIEYRIDLCRALAGGWDMPRPTLLSLEGERRSEPGTPLVEDDR